MVAGSVTGLLVYGPLDRWLDSRKFVVIGGTLISASLLATLALMAHPPLILVTVLLALYGIAGSYYITNITLGRAHYPDHLIGRGVTLINLCTFIGVAVVQFSTAYLMGFFAMGEGNAAAPVLAYRILFGAFAAYTLIIGLLYTRAHDIKPSAERARRQKAESPDSRTK
jgi:MFS family permease